MKTTKKLIKIGDSIGFIIDKPLLKRLKLIEHDLIEIKIKKIKNEKQILR